MVMEVLKSVNLEYNTPGRWVDGPSMGDQASDVPSIIFFFHDFF